MSAEPPAHGLTSLLFFFLCALIAGRDEQAHSDARLRGVVPEIPQGPPHRDRRLPRHGGGVYSIITVPYVCMWRCWGSVVLRMCGC